MSKLFDQAHSKRYLLAAILFLLLVLGKFHESSIGEWDSAKSSTILGISRIIRSDEWVVNTPWILSQNMQNFPVINDTIRSDGQNMILTNAPTLSPDLLGKPYFWGFLLFGREYGFSWFWLAKLFLLFLLSYEIALYLTGNNRLFALLGAAWITLSPAIQWWFGTPAAFVELIIDAQMIITAAIYYVRFPVGSWRRLLMMLFMAMGVIGFATVLYPGLQVPLGYLTLIFVLNILLPKRKELLQVTREKLLAAACAGLVIFAVGAYIRLALPALEIMFHTVYPGSRISTGGTFRLADVQLYLINWLLPYKQLTLFLNSSEASAFFNFFPVVLLIFFTVLKRAKGNRKLAISLFVFLCFQLAWMFISFPVAFAKITLMAYVPEHRLANIVFGLTAVYLSLWMAGQLAKYKPFSLLQACIISLPIGALYYYSLYTSTMVEYLTPKFALPTLVFFVLLNILLLLGKKRAFTCLMLVLIVVSGAVINPISRGLNPIYDRTIVHKLQEINNEHPNQTWGSAQSLINGQLLVASGLKTYNSVHFYPDLAQWQKLDPSSKYAAVYNRYAYVMLNITESETSFELRNPDVIMLNLNVQDLAQTDIKYILSQGNMRGFAQKLKELYYEPSSNLYIYEVISP